MNIVTINPATEEITAQYELMSESEVDMALDCAVVAQKALAALSLEERCAILRRVADVLRERSGYVAELISTEMGKPLAEARAEIEKSALLCTTVANMAGAVFAEEMVEVEAGHALLVHQPLGVVLAVMPWNFPVWQTMRFAAGAIASGNGMMLKSAPITTGTGLATISVLEEAGVPRGAMSALIVSNEAVATVIADDRIRGVTFTGSTETGSVIAAAAGRAVKKCLLELGGSDAYIVCEDADLNVAVRACVEARLVNTGQSCIAGKRFLVHHSLYDEFVERMSASFDAIDQLRPLARADIRNNVMDQINRAVAAGGTITTRRSPANVPDVGYYVRPTVVCNVPPDSAIASEEVFGPVAFVTRVASTEEALKLANASPFGLGGAVFSRNESAARAVALAMDTGMVAINDGLRSHPLLPFGGVKRSGFGRELGSAGLLEFTNLKVVRLR